jgi:hypothetical protein
LKDNTAEQDAVGSHCPTARAATVFHQGVLNVG